MLVDSDWASQLRSELQFLSQPVTRIVSDDNNRIQFPRPEWNNRVLIYVTRTFVSRLLQKEARLFSSFQFSVPSYTLKERKNWWHKILFLAKQILAAWTHQIQTSLLLSNHLSEMLLIWSSWKIPLLRLRIYLSLGLRWTCDLARITIYVYVCICIAHVNQSSDPSMEWHTYNNRAE